MLDESALQVLRSSISAYNSTKYLFVFVGGCQLEVESTVQYVQYRAPAFFIEKIN